MSIIVRIILKNFAHLMNPQSEGEYELGGENHAEQSRGCIATSYLPLSDI
jgi:hypothetical protein